MILNILPLPFYGIRGRTLAWIIFIKSLTSSLVVLDGGASGTVDVTLGIPQGSVLGPIMFFILINNLSQ